MQQRIEWRTIIVAGAIYGGWVAATLLHDLIAWPLLVLVGAWLIAWHGSLQHETIHGHPTASRRINGLIGGVPLSLWIPYRVYARSHRAHHGAIDITHPRHDPESRYAERAGWLARVRMTLAGQLLIGPVASIAGFLAVEARRSWHAPRDAVRDWLPHLLGVAGILAWLAWVGMPLLTYLLAFVLPGQALTLLRGFAEHRADAAGPSRAATVTSRGPLALLFLNNNLHAAHHAHPAAPWYLLPAIERARAGGMEPRYAGYGDVVRRFALRAHDTVLHPRAAEPAA